MECILIEEQLEDRSYIDSITIKSVKFLSHKKYRIWSDKIKEIVFRLKILSLLLSKCVKQIMIPRNVKLKNDKPVTYVIVTDNAVVCMVVLTLGGSFHGHYTEEH